MESRFDSLAKAVSGAVSRRQAFLRLGSGLGVGALALFGLGSKAQAQDLPCAQCCATICVEVWPDKGPGLAACITNCLVSEGQILDPAGSDLFLCGPACT